MKCSLNKYFALSIWCLQLLYGGLSLAQKSEDNTFKLIISSSMFQNVKTEDVYASTKILASELKKDMKSNEQYEIIVCSSIDEILERIKTPFDVMYLSPIEYLKLKKKFDLEPALISEIDNNYGDIYYLITNKNENVKSIIDLKNSTINILSNADEQPPTIWLDKLLRENKLPAKHKFFKQVNLDYKSNNVVLPVYFKKTGAAIVTKSGFELICELNPHIKEEIIVIHKSNPMMRAIFCFDGRNNDAERKRFLSDYLQKLHASNHGKQILNLYMVKRIIPYKAEYIESILDLYK